MDGRAQSVVVVADDDPALRLLCRVNLELEGYRVLEATNAAEVGELIGANDVDAVLLDVHLGADDGVALARRLHDERPEVGVALFSGTSDRPDLLEGIADGFLGKPFTLEGLSETVRQLVRR